jgi:hypothetical protein
VAVSAPFAAALDQRFDLDRQRIRDQRRHSENPTAGSRAPTAMAEVIKPTIFGLAFAAQHIA